MPAGPDYKRKQSNLGERNDMILNDRNSVSLLSVLLLPCKALKLKVQLSFTRLRRSAKELVKQGLQVTVFVLFYVTCLGCFM